VGLFDPKVCFFGFPSPGDPKDPEKLICFTPEALIHTLGDLNLTDSDPCLCLFSSFSKKDQKN